jgi:Ankyrin repeats (many copies)
MTEPGSPNVEVIDLAPGLWIWRLEHPAWNPHVDWQQVVTCTCVDAGDERWLLDPLLPPDDANQVWHRLAERPPTAVAVLLADHLRETWSNPKTWSIDAAVRHYRCRAFGPHVWDPDQGPPETKVQTIQPNDELPGGLFAFRDPRGWNETPLWLPEHRALVFGDTLTERSGSLRVWMSPTHYERALPDLRAMLDLPFERVIISRGEPVHTREAFERALDLPPWPATPLHQAAYAGNFERVRSLVEARADVTARDELYNGTALDWAESGGRQDWAEARGHQQIIAYLKSMIDEAGRADD